MTTNGNTTVFNEAQIQLLDMMSFVKKEETLKSLRHAISDYFAKEADKEIEKLWANGDLDNEKIESFRNLHERTPYIFKLSFIGLNSTHKPHLTHS